MDRDSEILCAFELADDAMQGVFGYHLYVNASVQSASFKEKISKITKYAVSRPPNWAIPITHSWVRYFSPNDLVETMEKIFDSYHARSSLMTLPRIFEVALRSFVDRLKETGHGQKLGGNPRYYKTLLIWAFDFSNLEKESLYGGGEKEMINRVPNLCCDVDDARRLRNLFMHNNGLFDMHYKDDAITIPDRQPKMHPKFSDFLKDPTQKVPVLLTYEEYVKYSCSHIELLHDLHDLIQRKYFGLTGGGYYYKQEQKIIEWHRVLTSA